MQKIFKGVYVVISLFLFLAAFCRENDERENVKPNIVFVLVDDLGWRDLGAYGSTFYETRNIDNFAAESVVFTNAYSSSPVCSPSRASIFTGRYPSRVGITDWIPGLDPQNRKLLGTKDLHELPLKEYTIAEVLKEDGYKTFFAGKWHLGDTGYFPEQQGFDFNYGGHHMGQPPGGYYSPYDNPKLEDGPEGEYLTDRLTDEALNFIETNKEHPFFIFLSFYTVHTPIQANKEYVGKFEKKLQNMKNREIRKVEEHDAASVQNQVNPEYASMVYALDQNFGRLQNKLTELGLYEKTMVIFTSDNGGLTTLPKNVNAPTSVKPLRAGKGWCYEGGIRVPLIVKKPFQIGSFTTDIPVIGNDFFPTIIEISGVKLLADQQMDGKSLAGLLNGESNLDRDALFWHFPHYHGSMWTPGAAIRKGNWKLLEFYDLEKTELYDLGSDVEEQNDLSEQFPGKVRELLDLLHFMQKETNAKLPTSN